jgi:hypothetical protein
MNLLHPFLHFVMAYYIFLKEDECILPTLQLVFTFFAIVVDGLPQIVHSWNFIFLFTWLSQYCGDIFQLCLPTLLIETHYRWFLYQFVSLVFHQFVYRPMSDERLPPKVVFFFYACGCATRSYMPSLYMDLLPLLLVGLHTVIYDSYYAIPTLVDSTLSP